MWISCSDVTGSTAIPRRSIRNGYSLVPWLEPRYFTMRSRRVEIWSLTRWSSKMTQSETYSSSPCRVSVSVPRSPVMTAVMPRVLQPREQPAQLGAQHAGVAQPGEQRLDRVEDDALGADRPHRVVEPDEQPFEIVFAGLLDLGALDADVVDRQALAPDERGEVVAERARRSSTRSCPRSPRRSRRRRLSPCAAPCIRNSRAEERLAAAGPPHTSVGRPRGQPASGDLVETVDAGDDFFEDWRWKCRSSAGCFLTRAAGRHER